MSRRTSTAMLVMIMLLMSITHVVSGNSVAGEANILQAAATSRTLLPLVHGPPLFSAPSKPLHLSPSVDSSRAVSAKVPTSGGTLTATAADGARFTLTLPRDALLTETTITLTPVRSVSGLPRSVAFVAGVDVQPDGLRLYQAATLAIEPPASKTIPVEREVSFASLGNGAQAHLYPLQIQPRVPTFSLFHFSKYYVGDGITLDMSEYVPTLTEDQIQHYMHELIRAQREAHQRGEAGDPRFGDKLEYLFREYFYVVIAPNLPAVKQDCATGQRVIPRAIGWQRQVELLGLGPRFTNEWEQIESAWIASIDRCWNEAVKPCLDKNNAAAMERAIGIARQAALAGLEGYNPFDTPACNCSNVTQVTGDWIVTVNFTYSDEAAGPVPGNTSIHQGTSQHSANVMGRLTQREPGVTSWTGSLTGEARIYDMYHVSYPDKPSWTEVKGSGAPLPEAVSFSVNADNCTYFLWVPIRVAAQHSDSEGKTFSSAGFVANLHLVYLPVQWTAETTNFTIRDTRTLTIGSERERARISFGYQGYTLIRQLRGMPGEVTVSWSIAPASTPSGP